MSQYLIAKVIYEGDWSPEDTLFRILLFKFFNRIETWEMLEARVGPISYGGYRFERYDLALSEALAHGLPVYSPAYIMPSPGYGHARKHANHLALLESIMRDRVSARVARCRSMREMFELLLSYRGVGAFLAFQYATDLNYSDLTDFAESDFVVPGPGARNGIQKCFPDLGGTAEDDLIRLVSERQEEAFSQLGLHPVSLWGRRVQLIDCQNLFCEIDKYARVAHPDVLGRQHRTRIKQHYSPGGALEKPWFPPKWGVNESVERWIQSAHASL